MGYAPEALANYMTLLGWSPPEGMGERFRLEEAARVFDFARVNRAGARFDWDKLNWLNAQVLHDLPPPALATRLRPLWAERGWGLAGATADPAWQEELCALIGPSLTLLCDGVRDAEPFFQRPTPDAGATAQLEQEGAAAVLLELIAALPPASTLAPGAAQELLTAAATRAGVKKGVLMKSLRAALLGSLQGPDLISSWRLLHAIGEDGPRLRGVCPQGSIP
jgi:glutamyl-tRNA synthetase